MSVTHDGLFLLNRTFLAEAFRIPTGSMENTLLAGDRLLENMAVSDACLPENDVVFTSSRTLYCSAALACDGVSVACDGAWVTCDGVSIACDGAWITCDRASITCDGVSVTCDGAWITCDGAWITCDGVSSTRDVAAPAPGFPVYRPVRDDRGLVIVPDDRLAYTRIAPVSMSLGKGSTVDVRWSFPVCRSFGLTSVSAFLSPAMEWAHDGHAVH